MDSELQVADPLGGWDFRPYSPVLWRWLRATFQHTPFMLSSATLSPENRVRSNNLFSSKFTCLRGCRVLISTKCAGMGSDIADIKLTVCIGNIFCISMFRYFSLARTSQRPLGAVPDVGKGGTRRIPGSICVAGLGRSSWSVDSSR